MKILVVYQHYWPEPFMISDICEELVSRGHEVHVVTGVPNYPMGYIYPEYRNGQNREQVRNGVKITRTYTVGRRHNVLFRFLNYYSYMFSSTNYVKSLPDDYDVVFCNETSPVMMVNAGLKYAEMHNKKTVLYCQDLWPACLAAGGISSTSPIYRYYHGVSRNLYRRADRILISSSMFRNYLEEQFEIDDDKISYLPQFASDLFEDTAPADEQKETCDFVFAGNIGAAQDLETLVETAVILKNRKITDHGRPLRFHIVGDGSELTSLQNLAKEKQADNIIFYGRKPIEEMPEYYSMADAMIVTLGSDPFIELTLPAKVQSYMASGKPVIAAANGEIANVVNESRCGFCAAAGDSAGLAYEIIRFIQTENRCQLGLNGKEYYQNHFRRSVFMDHLEKELYNHCTNQENAL